MHRRLFRGLSLDSVRSTAWTYRRAWRAPPLPARSSRRRSPSTAVSTLAETAAGPRQAPSAGPVRPERAFLGEGALRKPPARPVPPPRPGPREDATDPALVLHVDARRRQVRLRPVQEALVWSARQKEYHGMLHRIVACLQSHQSPIEQCHTLLALHEEVVRRRLRLRADTYADLFHVFYAAAVSGGGHRSSREGEEEGGPGTAEAGAAAVAGGLPAEWASPAAAATALLSPHGLERLWQVYRYMVDSGTDPAASTIQSVMGVLEHHSLALRAGGAGPTRGMEAVEAKAHALFLDLDRFGRTPTAYTVNAYIGVCEAAAAMHLALARVADFQTRHEQQPPPGMYARLLTGLLRHGHHAEAMGVVTTMQSVALSTHLLNAVLHAARHSPDPRSAFTCYRAVLRSAAGGGRAPGAAAHTARLVPSLHTISILLEVLDQTGEDGELSFVLAEMRRYGIKGNGRMLNKILRLLLAAGRTPEAAALRTSMERKRVVVFDEHRTLLDRLQRITP